MEELATIIAAASPLVYAVVGETISEKAGVINLSLDGSIMLSALAGFAAAYESGSALVGFVAAAAVGMAVALTVAFSSIVLRLNQVAVGFVRRRFVKGHDDVRTQRHLDFHRFFGRQEMRRTVQVRLKRHALLRNFGEFVEAEHLEAAAVGQNGMAPVHEAVQSAELLDQFMARSEVEMIGVPQDYLRTKIADRFGKECLYRALCSHGHEDGRIHLAMRCRDFAQSCIGGSVFFK